MSITPPPLAPPPPDPPRPGFVRRNLMTVSIGGIVVLAGLAWLAFGYFGVHTLFIDDEVDEATPTFASGATTDDPTGDAAASDGDVSVSGDEPGTDADAADAGGAVAAGGDATTDGTPASSGGSETPSDGAATEVVTVAAGDFVGLDHPTSGIAVVLNDGTEQRFLRFEDFETDNGPDLNVYLAPGGDVGAGFVDLGDLKGNIGPQNYEIPVDVDLSEFDTVVIWCVRFGVGFGEATLTS